MMMSINFHLNEGPCSLKPSLQAKVQWEPKDNFSVEHFSGQISPKFGFAKLEQVMAEIKKKIKTPH